MCLLDCIAIHCVMLLAPPRLCLILSCECFSLRHSVNVKRVSLPHWKSWVFLGTCTERGSTPTGWVGWCGDPTSWGLKLIESLGKPHFLMTRMAAGSRWSCFRCQMREMTILVWKQQWQLMNFTALDFKQEWLTTLFAICSNICVVKNIACLSSLIK